MKYAHIRILNGFIFLFIAFAVQAGELQVESDDESHEEVFVQADQSYDPVRSLKEQAASVLVRHRNLSTVAQFKALETPVDCGGVLCCLPKDLYPLVVAKTIGHGVNNGSMNYALASYLIDHYAPQEHGLRAFAFVMLRASEFLDHMTDAYNHDRDRIAKHFPGAAPDRVLPLFCSKTKKFVKKKFSDACLAKGGREVDAKNLPLVNFFGSYLNDKCLNWGILMETSPDDRPDLPALPSLIGKLASREDILHLSFLLLLEQKPCLESLGVAIDYEKKSIIQPMIHAGAPLQDTELYLFQQPLSKALGEKNGALVRLLLQAGASLTTKFKTEDEDNPSQTILEFLENKVQRGDKKAIAEKDLLDKIISEISLSSDDKEESAAKRRKVEEVSHEATE